jgi:hypothetical protein
MLRQKRIIPFVIFLGLAALCFLSCDNGTTGGDEPGDALELGPVTAVENQGPVFYSLSTGEQVTGDAVAGKGWDIAFDYSRMIYTNSGATAEDLGTGGLGGVWASGKTDFNAVQSPDGADFTLPFTADTKRYTSPAAEMGLPVLNRLNVITYVGYGEGTGTEGDPLTDYKFNANQYYNADLSTMPPVYSITKQVYIVKHGTGEAYSRVQITAMDTQASTKGNKRIFIITYQNF